MTYCHKLGSGGWCQSTAPCLPGECKYKSAYTILSTNNTAQSGTPSESPSDFITRQIAEVERLTAENAALRKDAERLRNELRIIATAKPSEWDADMRDQFQPWAQNRARAAMEQSHAE